MLRPYERNLLKEGFAASRVADLWTAMDALHAAIARLDLENRKLFWEKSLSDRLDDFSYFEQLAQVTPEGDANDS